MIYKCSECVKPCIIDFGIISDSLKCPNSVVGGPNWQQTDEYEIVKKNQDRPTKYGKMKNGTIERITFFEKTPEQIIEYIKDNYNVHKSRKSGDGATVLFKSEEELQDRIKNNLKTEGFSEPRRTRMSGDQFKNMNTTQLENIVAEYIENKTPNCSICEWSETRDQKQLFTGQKVEAHGCGAMAWKSCCSVYNNKNCKSLFKEKSGRPETDNDEDSRQA